MEATNNLKWLSYSSIQKSVQEFVQEKASFLATNFSKCLDRQVNMNLEIINENTKIHSYFLEKSVLFYETKHQGS